MSRNLKIFIFELNSIFVLSFFHGFTTAIPSRMQYVFIPPRQKPRIEAILSQNADCIIGPLPSLAHHIHHGVTRNFFQLAAEGVERDVDCLWNGLRSVLADSTDVQNVVTDGGKL